MQKLYCYVDENGQDTGGKIFVLAVVLLYGDSERALKLCEEIEVASRKGKFKWGKAQQAYRLEYLRRIFNENTFTGSLYYSVFLDTRDYELATIQAIARTITLQKLAPPYAALIYVDGLSKTKRHTFSVQLRRLGIHPRKVQGVSKDENNALIRLADALAGFARDVLDGVTGETRTLFDQARSSGMLIEL